MKKLDDLHNLEGKICQSIDPSESGNGLIFSFSPEGHEIEIFFNPGVGSVELDGEEVEI